MLALKARFSSRAALGTVILLTAGLALGCGSSASPPATSTQGPPTAVPSTPVPSPVFTEVPTPSPTAVVSATSTPSPTSTQALGGGGGNQEDLIAEGKLIFEVTAGGVGCALCHGLDGKGKAEFAAPPNRGATEDQIWNALAERPQMGFITLTDAEIKAVAAYLQYLGTQP